MKRAFADTVYWVARINPRDQWHATYRAVGGLSLVTSDEVLDEVLAHFSAFGPAMRSRAAGSGALGGRMRRPCRNRPSQVYRTMTSYVHSRKEVTTTTISRNFATAGIGKFFNVTWAAMIRGRWAR